MIDLSIHELGLQIERITKNYDSVLIVASKGMIKRKILTNLGFKNIDSIQIWSDFSSNPDIFDLDSQLDQIQKLNLSRNSLIIAIGGGSTIDVSKALSIMIPNDKKIIEILSMAQNAETLVTIDLLAIPTTAGSGSECTSFATIWDRENSIKRSLDLPQLRPKYALFCSSLLQTLPTNSLLYSALDARAHAIESLWSLNSDEQSENYARKSLEISLNKLGDISKNQKDLSGLLESSKYAGQAINVSRTSVSHAISYPLTLQLGIPHGLAAALTLRKVWERFHKFYSFNKSLKKIVDEATLEIESLKLANYVSEFTTREQIMKVIPQIKLNSRFANFIVKIDESEISDVINDSLAN